MRHLPKNDIFKRQTQQSEDIFCCSLSPIHFLGFSLFLICDVKISTILRIETFLTQNLFYRDVVVKLHPLILNVAISLRSFSFLLFICFATSCHSAVGIASFRS